MHGSRSAIADRSGTITYAALRKKVRRIAILLDRLLGDDMRPVALLLAHSAMFPIAMLAVLASGRGYVPLDPAFPEARNRQILEQARASALLTDATCRTAARVLAGSALAVHEVGVWADVPVDESWTRRPGSGGDLAYVVFTSGTTGSPKGVFQEQAGLLHDVLQYSNAAHIAPTDRLTLLYSPSVGGAIRDIFGALLNGAALHVLDPRTLGPDGLARALRALRITVYHSVPVLFRRVMAALEPEERLPDLRLAYLAGDRVEPADVTIFRAHTEPDAFFYTGIGASEVATLYAHMFLAAGDPLPGPRLPVGHAIPDRVVTLLDAAGEPVPDGETGQIAVTSHYLARGYWGNPTATARAFHAQADGTRRYPTGDLGRWRPDGRLEHLGRADHQVKIRGHRIELGDVESALSAQPGVGEAAALVRQESEGGGQVLVALWAPSSDGARADTATLRAALRDRLAPWAVPGRFVRLEALPRLANHKLDRQALAGLVDAPVPEPEAPGTESDMLDRVLAVVHEATGLAVGPDQQFGEHGIDSLHAVQILAALERDWGRRLLPALVSPDGTARRIADYLRRYLEHGLHTPVVLKAGRDTRQPPLLVMADVAGDFRDVGRLVQALPDLRDYLGFADADQDVPDAPRVALAAIAARTVTAILAAGLRPPHALLGYSFGGRLAYAVGARLRALGHTVGFVGMVDTTMRPPGFHPPRPDDAMVPGVRRQALRLWSRAEASRLYRPEPSDLRVTLFRSATRWPGENAMLGWDEVAAEVRVVPVGGEHQTMLHPQHLAGVEVAVRLALAAADAQFQ